MTGLEGPAYNTGIYTMGRRGTTHYATLAESLSQRDNVLLFLPHGYVRGKPVPSRCTPPNSILETFTMPESLLR